MTPHNLCRSCGIDFGSVKAFDKHRVGKHEYLYDEVHPDGRRCMSADEMRDAHFVSNAFGRLTLPGAFLEGSVPSTGDCAANSGIPA